MAGNEIVIVEPMYERAFDSRKGALIKCFPRDVVGNEKKFGAEGAHSFEFRFWRCFDRDDRARNARLSRGVGNSLPRIAGADCPNPALALFVTKHRDCICRAAQFVSVDRLQVFQFEPNVWKIRPELQPDERRSYNRFGDPLPRIFDFIQLNRPNGIRGSFHLNRRYRQRPLRLGASRAARPVRVCPTDEREDAARFRPRRARC